MDELIFYYTMRQGLWVSLLMSTPILTVALIVGVVIGLLQALTSVQEMTLTFVPKLGAIMVVFWATMGFMTATLNDFFTSAIIPLIVNI
jgi:flagellar biosynthetic protein FliQ